MHLEFQPNRPRDPSCRKPVSPGSKLKTELQTVSLIGNWQFMREDHCPSWELLSLCRYTSGRLPEGKPSIGWRDEHPVPHLIPLSVFTAPRRSSEQ